MPCEECGHLLCVDPDEELSLFCPRCNNLPYESNAIVQAATNWLLEDHFTDENIIQIIDEYSKNNLIINILTRLNHVANQFFQDQEVGIPINDFGYFPYILKQIYRKDNFGDEYLEDPWELDDELRVLRDAYTELVLSFRAARDQFLICIRRDEFSGQFENFASDYELYQSEYGLCFERCVKSILGGDLDNYETYVFVADNLRSVDKRDVEDVSTSWEFTDAWYDYLLQMRMIASSDTLVNDAYFTRLPEHINIFHIEEFIDRIDNCFTQRQHEEMVEEGIVCSLEPDTVDLIGRQTFGNSWNEVRDFLIISEDSLDAHPFLWMISDESLPESTSRILYPRFFARILKFQVFPLLRNGNNPTSHELLSSIASDRGPLYERNWHDYLVDMDIECYQGAELTRNEPNEIDLLLIKDELLIFVEMKYFLPPIRINGPEGIRIIDEKFDVEIFNQESDTSNRTADGKPFPEKVSEWMRLEPGESFTSRIGPENDNRVEQEYRGEWADYDDNKYVVSNVVPSYIEKQDVRFLTDLEFYRWIEYDENVFYSIQ
jgi:hypothetical protein